MTTDLLDPQALDRTLKIIDEHAEVVIEDIAQIPRADWLKQRTKGIGGSDAAAVLDMSPFTSRYALWSEKVGEFGDPSEDDSELLFWGLELEDRIVSGFSKREGLYTIPYRRMLRSREWPWMIVNLDALIPERTAVLEVKNVNVRNSSDWSDGMAPEHYGVQVDHEQAVTGLPDGYLAALVGGNALRVVSHPRDEGRIAELVEREREFWALVTSVTPPEVDDSDWTKAALAAQFAEPVHLKEVELDPLAVHLIEGVNEAKARKAEAERDIDGFENTLRSMLGDAEIGTILGNPVVTWKKQSRDAHMVRGSEFRKFHYPKPKRPKK